MVSKNENRIEGHNSGVRTLDEIKGKGDWAMQDSREGALRSLARQEVEAG
jgi:hypothetical protein